VEQIATNIDDMNPQLFERATQQLFAAGAYDVWLQSAQMKKGRPGVVLSALAPRARADAVVAALVAETTTIGVRRWATQRTTLARAIETVPTTLGPVRVKIVNSPGGVRARAEFDDCRAVAERTGKSLPSVMTQVESEVAGWLKTRRQ
ncbi:MAG: LarC family nickel insertion protein, partial [Candidatus Eremiobacteraeota bacterium]|nr:LarC family nickel insertion protein [Candidatus Eremiobacteraeota bacterium]